MQKIICFHNPNEPNGYLSNWYPSPFTIDSQTFSCLRPHKQECYGDITAKVAEVIKLVQKDRP